MTTNLNDYSNTFVLITNGKHAGCYGFVESIHESYRDGALGIVGGLENGDRFESLIAPENVRVLDHEDEAHLKAAKVAAQWFYAYDITAKCDYLKSHNDIMTTERKQWLCDLINTRTNLFKQITNF